MANTVRYIVKSNTHKSYIARRTRTSTTGRRYAWTSNRAKVVYFTNRDAAYNVARRYGGRIVTA